MKSALSDNVEKMDEVSLEQLFKIEQRDPNLLSFDMWGSCRAQNLQEKLEENRQLKPLRVHIFKLVTDYLSSIKVDYFIYGGTALSVYREGGKMIEHDSDTDVAILETDFGRAVKSKNSFPAIEEGHVVMPQQNSLYWHDWFDTDGKEIPFNGNRGKRLKFCATKELFARFGITTGAVFDEGLVHVDVFTLGQHPDDPNCFCVNWNIPGHYDYKKKAFPKSIFFPLKKYHFEGLEVSGMNELKAYLEIEYGYLGRGAIYDNVSQLYVKIPENMLQSLPVVVQQHFNSVFETSESYHNTDTSDGAKL